MALATGALAGKYNVPLRPQPCINKTKPTIMQRRSDIARNPKNERGGL